MTPTATAGAAPRERPFAAAPVAESAAMREVLQLADDVAPTPTTVLLLGESGSGKEILARHLHGASQRAAGPWVAVNCAALPAELLESELFGHERGAFTGATERRAGRFEQASGGTLLLDEISELPLALQAKLLRVLQEREFEPVGSERTESVDVRVIAATNAVPSEAVKSGKLREDLYYRLNVFEIELPPLRNRKDDLPLLIQSFLAEFSARNGKSVTAIDPAAMRILDAYHWPGNVRELRNVIERAVILSSGEFVEPKHLPPLVVDASDSSKPVMSLQPGMTVDEAEQRLILMTLEHTRDNKTRAADILGISLKTLHNKLNKFRGRVPGKSTDDDPTPE